MSRTKNLSYTIKVSTVNDPSDNDFVDWNTLSDDEKMNIANHLNEIAMTAIGYQRKDIKTA